ncbi:MAG TPA: hypothetical protein DCF63_18515 [Planctomycetaceae bacterium]|nr:hypothetical protein [Planctomycetaceae bacterium]
MPEYTYVARDRTGQKKSGTLTAVSQQDVLQQLDSANLLPVEIKISKSAGAFQQKRVSGQVMANVYNQLAALLRSGAPLIRSLTVLANQTRK